MPANALLALIVLATVLAACAATGSDRTYYRSFCHDRGLYEDSVLSKRCIERAERKVRKHRLRSRHHATDPATLILD